MVDQTEMQNRMEDKVAMWRQMAEALGATIYHLCPTLQLTGEFQEFIEKVGGGEEPPELDPRVCLQTVARLGEQESSPMLDLLHRAITEQRELSRLADEKGDRLARAGCQALDYVLETDPEAREMNRLSSLIELAYQGSKPAAEELNRL